MQQSLRLYQGRKLIVVVPPLGIAIIPCIVCVTAIVSTGITIEVRASHFFWLYGQILDSSLQNFVPAVELLDWPAYSKRSGASYAFVPECPPVV